MHKKVYYFDYCGILSFGHFLIGKYACRKTRAKRNYWTAPRTNPVKIHEKVFHTLSLSILAMWLMGVPQF